MKEFLKTNTVTYNLMSFTGFKSIYIFSLLLDGPKSYSELQTEILNQEYLKESVSIDTLRIYLNSLKEIGCKIKKSNHGGITKYSIATHPFELNIDDKQIKSIIKIYKAVSKSIEVKDLISLQTFFDKISKYITNEELKTKLKHVCPLNNIDPKLIHDLITYAENNTEITMLYNSQNSGRKNITILVDKIAINNGKLYIYGINSEYENYSSFLVSKILKIISINLHNTLLKIPDIVVGYEYTPDKNETLELLNSEKILKQDNNKYLIELTSKNKFDIMQRIMSHAGKCKVLYPGNIKSEVIANLKKMKEEYLEKI